MALCYMRVFMPYRQNFFSFLMDRGKQFLKFLINEINSQYNHNNSPFLQQKSIKCFYQQLSIFLRQGSTTASNPQPSKCCDLTNVPTHPVSFVYHKTLPYESSQEEVKVKSREANYEDSHKSNPLSLITSELRARQHLMILSLIC